MPSRTQRVTLCIDPRFSGGTSSAVAREIHAFSQFCTLRLAAVSSRMFNGLKPHDAITAACNDTDTPIDWNPRIISADAVILHNPSFLKFDSALAPRIYCDLLVVVAHENFLRPGGAESFDVRHCLDLVRNRTTAQRKMIAPIAGWNRDTVLRWLDRNDTDWGVTQEDWSNICDFPLQEPTPQPRDRRGRHSRPGFEKFPPIDVLRSMFSGKAESVRIMGADYLPANECPANWDLLPFGSEPVDRFLRSIDFMVYYTNPMWRESFGRVLAEAMAAGKVVITDPETARIFGDGAVAAQPEEVDAIVERLVASPADYRRQALRGQAALQDFTPDQWSLRVQRILPSATSALETRCKPHDLL